MKRLIAAAAALALALPGCSDEPQAESRFDGGRAFRDLRDQVEIGARPSRSGGNAKVVRLIASRLRAAGARDVRVQRPWRNVVATIPGSEPGAVVVGAHHDTKDAVAPEFSGANDGASGVAVVLELARVLAADGRLSGPSIRLALFDAEEARGERPFAEDGARGSRQYVSYAASGGLQGSPRLQSIRAMVLFDLVGDCDLQLPYEASSDPALYAEFSKAAETVDGSAAPFAGQVAGAMDDHLPFLAAGIPAVDLIDFTYGPGPSPGAYWHTAEDTLDKVCPESLDAVGEAAVRALERIGG